MINAGRRTNLLYFRPGEVVLLLEPPDADASRKNTREVATRELSPIRSNELADALNRVGIKADPATVLGADTAARDGRPLLLRRQETDYALTTVNVAEWRPRGETERWAPDQMAGLLDGGHRAVQTLNRMDDFRLDGYQLVAASPNWLAMPFADIF